MKRYKRGFTLLELLVVLAVMGVMMGLIGFSLLGGGGNELGAAQRELLGLVQKARSQAALQAGKHDYLSATTRKMNRNFTVMLKLFLKILLIVPFGV